MLPSLRIGNKILLKVGYKITGLVKFQLFNPSSSKQVAKLFEEEVYREIIDSDAFRRLNDISFLGAIDYLIQTKHHTRYQHSIGVALLALEYANKLNLCSLDEQHLVIAALLHDIGHPPLSHSLEPVFKEKFDIWHHKVGKDIIRGDAPIGRSIKRILTKYNIDKEVVISLIDGKSEADYAEAFKSPINIDTIDGILRLYTYFYPVTFCLRPEELLNSLIITNGCNTKILDQFWLLKNTIYKNFINSKFGLTADYIAKKYMEKHIKKFSAEQYFMGESEFKKIHSSLFKTFKTRLNSIGIISNWGSCKIKYSDRKYMINESISVYNNKDIYLRYIKFRSPAVF